MINKTHDTQHMTHDKWHMEHVWICKVEGDSIGDDNDKVGLEARHWKIDHIIKRLILINHAHPGDKTIKISSIFSPSQATLH